MEKIMNIFGELIGYFAGICMAVSFLPQAIKTCRTKDVSGFSLGTYVIYNLGVISWVIYGAYLGSVQMVVFNSLCLCFSLPILFMVIKYRRE